MALLQEVDFYQTRENARRVLKSFRKWERIAGRSVIDLRSPIITDLPRNPSYGNKSEDALIQFMEAERHRDDIIAALMMLPLKSRQILYYSYCYREKLSNLQIAGKMDYSVRQIERMKSDALIEFAESYRKGRLIIYC